MVTPSQVTPNLWDILGAFQIVCCCLGVSHVVGVFQSMPDIYYAFGLVRSFMRNPLKQYFKDAKRIMSYINIILHYGTFFPKNKGNNKLELIGFSDVD